MKISILIVKENRSSDSDGQIPLEKPQSCPSADVIR